MLLRRHYREQPKDLIQLLTNLLKKSKIYISHLKADLRSSYNVYEESIQLNMPLPKEI